MPVDIRATVACSLGTVISGNVNDEYVQGTGLIKCSGTVVINGIITPAIGTAVTFTYTKSGITRSIPRKLRVLSSFADPFRRTTSVELGCKLTYLSDKRDSIDWTAFDDDENTLTEADAEIITIPIRAQAVAKKCMDELGVSGTFTLTNQFSVAEFDLSPGYVQVLSDLLVSESLCGYLDANEVLQVFSLDQPGGTGPVLDVTQLVDISKIGVGQLPGEAVTVSYSSLKLKQDVQQPGGGGGGGGILAVNNDPGWESVTKESRYQVLVPYRSVADGSSQIAVYNILETTTTTTSYLQLRTGDGETLRLPATRTTEFSTMAPAVIGNAYSEYLSNGINVPSTIIQKTTTETYRYNSDGIETFCEKSERGGAGFLLGSASVPIAFSPTDFVQIGFNVFIDLGRETRETLVSGGTSQVTVTTFGHWFRTLTGQQAIAQGRVSLSNSAQVASYINSLLEIGLCLVETRTDIESASRPRSAPSLADINNATNAKGGTAGNGYRTESKAELALALGSATAQRRIELSLPYAPDDVFTKSGSTYGSVASDAAAKAQLYGRVQNRLLLGNRSGMNIQAAPEILPGAPFAPFVVKSGSTSALYRTNGTNWTFDAQYGLVASTDALFWGGVGGNAGESWFPVAPGIITLPTTPGTTTVNITDASGNVVGSYEQMTVTGTVPVAQETVALQATLRVRPVVTSLPYALQQTAEVAIATRLRAVVSSIKAISIPAAAVTVAGLAPKVSTGARVLVPTATVQVAAQAPGVSSGASVAVPAAGITVAGVVPDVVGRQKTIITVPVATVQVAGQVPLVASGASVAVPAAGIAVAGVVPASLGAFDPFRSSTGLSMHMDGANNSTTFTNSGTAALTITAGGNARITTAESVFGGASASFDGSSSITVNSNAALDLPGDFNIELRLHQLTAFVENFPIVLERGTEATANYGIILNNTTSPRTAAFFYGSPRQYVDIGTIVLAEWRHLAVSRSGSTISTFNNGSLVATATVSNNFTSSGTLVLGQAGSGAFNRFRGYIDELSITKAARRSAAFTVPAVPLPDR